MKRLIKRVRRNLLLITNMGAMSLQHRREGGDVEVNKENGEDEEGDGRGE